MTTQSTDLIGHFKLEDIVAVDQVNGESHFERLSSDTLKVERIRSKSPRFNNWLSRIEQL